MLVEIDIREVEHHQAILQNELREVQLAIDCLRSLSYRASQDDDLQIDYGLLSAHISYLNCHAEWINNRLSFLSKTAQKAAYLKSMTKDTIEEMIQMLNN